MKRTTPAHFQDRDYISPSSPNYEELSDCYKQEDELTSSYILEEVSEKEKGK
jgi:hypothetical protein